ncbi:TIGR00730 family Rossman fold protein [Pyruvatibacter sp.]|uniref:LOG family protein n=1 Tax=Pyruvatibacter sp. TaxID=1981328 RepID=UPI00326781B7
MAETTPSPTLSAKASSPTALCVYCGSSFGTHPDYESAASLVGRTLAERGIHVIFGGGRVGLMGTMADAALEAEGIVTGVTTKGLVEAEIAHEGLTHLHVVETMHQRKAKMESLSGGFVTLPGGVGTLEEIMEQWTWAQLGIHTKPCAFLNVRGYFDPMMAMVEHMRHEGFLKPDLDEMLIVEDDIGVLLDRVSRYQAPTPKWQHR